MIQNITVLGSGAMGTRIAKNLINEKFNVTVFNRNKNNAQEIIEFGASYNTTPAQAVVNADLVISMLTNDAAAKSVWLDDATGALAAMKKGAIAIESSTLSVDCIKSLSDKFSKHDIAFLDAPVLGSRPQAEAAALIYLVGGEEKSLAKVSPVLEKLSTTIHYLGKNTNGAIMKLAINAYFGTQVTALSEIIGLLQKLGINKQKSVDLFNQLPTTSPALQGIGTLIAKENFQPFFPIALVEKDFSYFSRLQQKVNVKMPTVVASHSNFKQALADGYADNNISGVSKIFIL